MQLFYRLFLTNLIVLTFSGVSLSQNDSSVLEQIQIFDKFGSVPQSQFRQAPNHDYPFEYLLKESTIRIVERPSGIVAIIDNLVRIRVLSDDQLEKAEASLVGIPFYFQDGIETITNLEAITHQPDGSQVRFDTENARTVDLNSRYKIIEFEMPEVQQGSILEYKYTLERRYIEELPNFYMAHRVPTKKAALYLRNSEFIRYDAVPLHVEDFDLHFEEHRVDTSNVPLLFTLRRPNPIYIEEWEAEDIPAVDASSYISSIDDIRAQIKFQISEFGIPRQPLENSWEFVAAQILRNRNPYQQIERYTEFQQMGEEIGASLNSMEEIQDSVFQAVNSSVQFSGVNSVFAEGDLSHVLEGEPADQAEINTVLLTMLRGAGIDAKPLYISGREFGRIDQSFPSIFQFNWLLIFSEINGQQYFMDASFPHSMPNLIPIESYNVQGMALTTDDYQWIDISPERSVFDLDIDITASLSSNGTLTGTLNAQTRGYPSQRIRRDMQSGRPVSEIIRETFFDIYTDAVISEGSLEINSQNRNIVDVATDFEIPNYAASFRDGIEFRPMVVGYLFRNPFESTQRRVPITLDAPELLSIHYTVDLPDGFSVDEMGETRATSLQGAALREQYNSEGNTVEYTFDIEISRKEFPADVYSQLRRIYERWVFLSNETWYIED
ncbi:DUF3857 domain-containing protein [Rhodohalobacter sp. 614A]|uniref:DUF3857 domain-containing protein n=1 Tax=Rhodohalobacter sp. 614A TaxID=2908649 RepID=UPI001F3FB569|nr:DUF3857 domain-containing protein [Rhodohalobacter sp. 614A]